MSGKVAKLATSGESYLLAPILCHSREPSKSAKQSGTVSLMTAPNLRACSVRLSSSVQRKTVGMKLRSFAINKIVLPV